MSIATLLVTGCANNDEENDKEQTYQEVIQLVKNKKWDEAIIKLDEISDYKDTNRIQRYIKARKEFEKEKHNDNDVLNMLPVIPQDGELREEMASFKQEVENAITHAKELNKSRRIMAAKDFIGKKDYKEAARAVVVARFYSDPELDVLFNYGMGMGFISDGDIENAKSYFSSIPDKYSGVLAKQINEAKIQVMKTPSPKKSTETKQTAFSEDPKIGMADYEVINSTWGSPRDINKTTTANGVFEQWVYDDGKYIYIENHYVVAIQE